MPWRKLVKADGELVCKRCGAALKEAYESPKAKRLEPYCRQCQKDRAAERKAKRAEAKAEKIVQSEKATKKGRTAKSEAMA